MDRALSRYGYLLPAILLVLSLTMASGCRTLATFAAYLIKGREIEADYNGLKGKKVAVVCRPMASLEFDNPTVARELARQVSLQLQANVSKIKVVEAQKVAAWIDKNEWKEFREVGKALGAERVVAVELQEFAVRQSHTLFQGKASYVITVHDCDTEGEAAFEKSGRSLYPPNTGISTMDMPEGEFRRKFLKVLADQIARHFYPHEPHADLMLDQDAM